MSSRRAASVLGPLIALLLIGGVTAVVLDGRDGQEDTDFAQTPGDSASPDQDGVAVDRTDTASPAPDGGPGASETATPGAVGGEAPGGSGDGPTPAPADPAEPAEPAGGSVDADVTVQDPTALTGGWVGGTPNTGTAVSAVGLVLLVVGGGLLWLRRSRA